MKIFFDTITPESAYIIGLIQADGTILPDRFSIAIKEDDIKFLHKIAKQMSSSRPIQLVNHPYGNVARLAINSSKMSKALQKWGIHSPRTWTAYTHPDLLMNRDYWRGVIDGDGSLCTDKRGRKILRLAGSKDICKEFLDFSRSYGCGKNVRVCKCKNIFTVCLNGNEAVLIASILYQDATLFLPRKRKVFLEWTN